MTPVLLIRHRLVVRFSDCDPLGHVNNAVYSTYLEQARYELWSGQALVELRRAERRQRRDGLILALNQIYFRSEAN